MFIINLTNMITTIKKLFLITIWFALLAFPVSSVLASSWWWGWSVLKPDNPFVNELDSWSAEEVNVIWSDKGQQDSVINVIRWYANWVLWIMGLIALLFLIYGWFLMVTSGWDEEKYKKWVTILRHAVIWLILIGTARFIISVVFWLINQTENQAPAAWTQS